MKRKNIVGLICAVLCLAPVMIVVAGSDNTVTDDNTPQPRTAKAASSSTIKGTSVYFTPMDMSSNCTVLSVYNTSTKPTVFNLTTYYLSGVTYVSTNIPIGATNMVRICSDEVSTEGSGWSSCLFINFTFSSAWGKLILPKGVNASGYIALNPAGTYDPIVDMPLIGLQFTSDKLKQIVP